MASSTENDLTLLHEIVSKYPDGCIRWSSTGRDIIVDEWRFSEPNLLCYGNLLKSFLERVELSIFKDKLLALGFVKRYRERVLELGPSYFRSYYKRDDFLWSKYDGLPLNNQMKNMANKVDRCLDAMIDTLKATTALPIQAGKASDEREVTRQKIQSPTTTGLSSGATSPDSQMYSVNEKQNDLTHTIREQMDLTNDNPDSDDKPVKPSQLMFGDEAFDVRRIELGLRPKPIKKLPIEAKPDQSDESDGNYEPADINPREAVDKGVNCKDKTKSCDSNKSNYDHNDHGNIYYDSIECGNSLDRRDEGANIYDHEALLTLANECVQRGKLECPEPVAQPELNTENTAETIPNVKEADANNYYRNVLVENGHNMNNDPNSNVIYYTEEVVSDAGMSTATNLEGNAETGLLRNTDRGNHSHLYYSVGNQLRNNERYDVRLINVLPDGRVENLGYADISPQRFSEMPFEPYYDNNMCFEGGGPEFYETTPETVSLGISEEEVVYETTPETVSLGIAEQEVVSSEQENLEPEEILEIQRALSSITDDTIDPARIDQQMSVPRETEGQGGDYVVQGVVSENEGNRSNVAQAFHDNMTIPPEFPCGFFPESSMSRAAIPTRDGVQYVMISNTSDAANDTVTKDLSQEEGQRQFQPWQATENTVTQEKTYLYNEQGNVFVANTNSDYNHIGQYFVPTKEHKLMRQQMFLRNEELLKQQMAENNLQQYGIQVIQDHNGSGGDFYNWTNAGMSGQTPPAPESVRYSYPQQNSASYQTTGGGTHGGFRPLSARMIGATAQRKPYRWNRSRPQYQPRSRGGRGFRQFRPYMSAASRHLATSTEALKNKLRKEIYEELTRGGFVPLNGYSPYPPVSRYVASLPQIWSAPKSSIVYTTASSLPSRPTYYFPPTAPEHSRQQLLFEAPSQAAMTPGPENSGIVENEGISVTTGSVVYASVQCLSVEQQIEQMVQRAHGQESAEEGNLRRSSSLTDMQSMLKAAATPKHSKINPDPGNGKDM